MIWMIQGWLFGMAYVAPIGMQNMYIINAAIQRPRKTAMNVALITVFFDITLALACFFGAGALMERVHIIKTAILGVGSAAVIVIGATLIRSRPAELAKTDVNRSVLQTVVGCFAVTWLNPQAILDGTFLLAGFRATLSGQAPTFFILGVCLASACWFLGLSMVVSIFKNAFSPGRIRLINIVCAIIMIIFGLKLAALFIMELPFGIL